MISLRPSLITEHHSVSSLNDPAREASPCSRYLRPARDEDTTYTVGGHCSRVDGDKRTERIEPRSCSPDASVDHTEARKPTVRRFGRSHRSAQPEGDGVGERFVRTLKKNLLWIRSFATVAELVEALREFKRIYNERWLIERHGFRSPRQVRLDSLAASEGLDAGPTCRRVG